MNQGVAIIEKVDNGYILTLKTEEDPTGREVYEDFQRMVSRIAYFFEEEYPPKRGEK